MFRYLHPNGVKVLSAEGVSHTLKNAKMPFITDLISKACPSSSSSASSANNNNDSDDQNKNNKNNNKKDQTDHDEEIAMFEQLKELPYTELDVARFCLCALWELTEKGIFDKATGELTPLAKRDMKKALSEAANGGKSQIDENNSASASASTSSNVAAVTTTGSNSGGASVSSSSSSVIGQGTFNGPRTQKNLRALLEEECAVAWPHTPVDKAVVFTILQDPNQPRHKPLFKATVEFPLLKKMKVEGDWAPTKRDAENSAADKTLPTVRRMLKK